MHDTEAMSKVGVMVIGLASAVCLLVAGCTPQSCGPSKCPTATYNVRALNDSTVTWSLAGGPPQTTTGFVTTDPPTGTDCSFAFGHGQIFPPSGDISVDRLLRTYLDVRCGGGGNGGFDLALWVSDDYRDWSAGTLTMTVPTGDFEMEFFGPVPAYSCTGTVDLRGLVMTVTVETATGGRAPYPQLVTSDFVRTFRLDFDTSTATATYGGGQACALPIVAQVSLHLTQTAADYVYDADAICYCE